MVPKSVDFFASGTGICGKVDYLTKKVKAFFRVMFQNKEKIVSAIELGTSKIAVLIGRFDQTEPDSLEVIGFGEAPSKGSVVKGEIVDMDAAFETLSFVLDEADKKSGHRLLDSCFTVIPVTGCGITIYHGVGSAPVRGENGIVTNEDCANADDNASILQLPGENRIISSFESYFTLDEGTPIRNPLGHTASRLFSHCLIVTGNANRLQNFNEIVMDSGVEVNARCFFSPSAEDRAILNEDECEHGVLMVDVGAGVTEFWVEFRSGVIGGGMFPIGFDHVLNDLSLGLKLPIQTLRNMAESGQLNQLFLERPAFWEVPRELGRIRKIPFSSMEMIVDARLQELFAMIHEQLEKEKLLSQLSAGGVLTGGGALFCRTQEIMHDCFDFSVRCGKPQNIAGAATGLDSPRYSLLWGSLKLAEFYARGGMNEDQKVLPNVLQWTTGGLKRIFSDIFEAFKV